MKKNLYVCIVIALTGVVILVVYFMHATKLSPQTEETVQETVPQESIETTQPIETTPSVEIPSTTPTELDTLDTKIDTQVEQTTIISPKTEPQTQPVQVVSDTKPIIVEDKSVSMSYEYDTKAMLSAHNGVRSGIGISPLQWSDTLARSAQKWSNTLRDTECTFKHDPNNTLYGENIFWSWQTGSKNISLISKPKDAVTWWANEVSFYDYKTNTCESGEVCGHYTQLVWKDTKEVGCGVSTCFDGDKQTDVWVCRYSPAGNIIGEKPY